VRCETLSADVVQQQPAAVSPGSSLSAELFQSIFWQLAKEKYQSSDFLKIYNYTISTSPAIK